MNKKRDKGSTTVEQVPTDTEGIVAKVRERYGKIARDDGSSCCGVPGPADQAGVAREIGYDAEDLESAPEEANLGLGCGAPIRHLALQPGETVLDLGSGAGFDAFLAAARVGPEGKVIGVDMTPDMLERATANAAKAGMTQVEFRQGRLESLPVEDGSIDAVTSNCVINLVPDKSKVFREVARVLRPGGRLVISDIVLAGPLPEALERDLMAYVGCVSGAMQRDAYFTAVRESGFRGIDVLEEVDYLSKVEQSMPEEVVEMIKRTGVRPEQVRGKVLSVTFRALRESS